MSNLLCLYSESTAIRQLGNRIFKFALIQTGPKPKFENLKEAIKKYNEALNCSCRDEESSYALKNLGISHLYCARTFIESAGEATSSDDLYQIFYYFVEGFEYLANCYCLTTLSSDWKEALLEKLQEGIHEAMEFCSHPEDYPDRLERYLQFKKLDFLKFRNKA